MPQSWISQRLQIAVVVAFGWLKQGKVQLLSIFLSVWRNLAQAAEESFRLNLPFELDSLSLKGPLISVAVHLIRRSLD
jgi:hypothetical protein